VLLVLLVLLVPPPGLLLVPLKHREWYHPKPGRISPGVRFYVREDVSSLHV
jgi:hypothetical protein